MEILSVKQRFGIIGSNPQLESAIEVALRVAKTDLSVLVTGESGVGKEFFPQIIHTFSARKHKNYIAVNCGAIPEGTIDSELFGHEKGAFTGATESRKGYFEMADGGTIFLDEVAELPQTTQVRLLRVLQSGEYIRVGSSKVQKTNVRVIAATNVNLNGAIAEGSFREDLYYRLNTVPILIPALRERKEDIHLLFRRFCIDIATQYSMPAITLNADARRLLEEYRWPGNIRQLKNVAEQISVIETKREIDTETLYRYLPAEAAQGGYQIDKVSNQQMPNSDRDILFTVLYDMRREIIELKRMVAQLGGNIPEDREAPFTPHALLNPAPMPLAITDGGGAQVIDVTDSVNVEPQTKEEHLREEIIKALKKNNGKRKEAARELFISERTLYRRIKELEIDETDCY